MSKPLVMKNRVEDKGSTRKPQRLKDISPITDRIYKNVYYLAANSWKGALIGVLVAIAFAILSFALYVDFGLPGFLNYILFILLFIAGFALCSFIILLLFKVVRNFNPVFFAIVTTGLLFANIFAGYYIWPTIILFEVFCGGLAGFALYRGIKKPLSLVAVITVLFLNIFLFYFLFIDGKDNTAPVTSTYINQKINNTNIENPSKMGAYKVNHLFYGSGTDKRRQEYGKNVNIKTQTVNANAFFDNTWGIKNYLREKYWGFNSKKLPLNGRVWYPEGAGPFPLVLIVHGNHLMNDFSEPGYDYLGKLLASRGYIFASVDENFLNESWFHDYYFTENLARGWLLLKHLENWKSWNNTANNVFYNKVDFSNIALIGHSRGGTAVAVASVLNKLDRFYGNASEELNFNFNIKGIVQIAPMDTYHPQLDVPVKMENINYLLLKGGHDQDVYWFMGSRYYNNIHYTDTAYHFKSALYIYKANHGQFNTVWGRNDRIAPDQWFLNLKPILPANEQRKIAEIYIAAFMDATLKNKTENIPLFKDHRQGFSFLPKDYYISQFSDTRFKPIVTYQEDLDVSTTSLKGCNIKTGNLSAWREEAIPLRVEDPNSQGTSAVTIGWDNKETKQAVPFYAIEISGTALNAIRPLANGNLTFDIFNNEGNQPLNFTIELVTAKTSVRKQFNDFMLLPPSLKTNLTKRNPFFSIQKRNTVEKILQYVEIPFFEFYKTDPAFDPSQLTEIRFVFDKTSSGEIMLDNIGIN